MMIQDWTMWLWWSEEKETETKSPLTADYFTYTFVFSIQKIEIFHHTNVK